MRCQKIHEYWKCRPGIHEQVQNYSFIVWNVEDIVKLLGKETAQFVCIGMVGIILNVI